MTARDKQKLIEEEVLRDQVKKLIGDKKQSNKLFDFLNSNFGLWFLTTIVIGLFTFFFNNYMEDQKKKNETARQIEKLDLEIEGRISQFWTHLESISQKLNDTAYTFKDGISPDTVLTFWKVFKMPACTPCDTLGGASVYNEFGRKSTIALIIELSSIAIEDNDKLRQSATFISGDGIYYSSKQPTIQELWSAFRDRIIISRWTNLFPYTDCGSHPFC